MEFDEDQKAKLFDAAVAMTYQFVPAVAVETIRQTVLVNLGGLTAVLSLVGTGKTEFTPLLGLGAFAFAAALMFALLSVFMVYEGSASALNALSRTMHGAEYKVAWPGRLAGKLGTPLAFLALASTGLGIGCAGWSLYQGMQ